ncbi:hypothetical protein [Candidatus Nitrosopumilus salaria]|nr:hypothetical protein [Candidatus Nitrosopumilus salaria]
METIWENIGGKTMSEKFLICPICDSENVAWILWGHCPDITNESKQDLRNRKTVLGGSFVTDHDAEWECNVCHHRWGYTVHNDESKINSFDYDQGFNIEEVYDQ